MTYRDPLYDKNTPGTDETGDERLADRNTGRASSGKAGSRGNQDAQQMKDTAKDKAQEMSSKAGELGDKAQSKADEMGTKAQKAADQGMDKASEGLDSTADMLRKRGAEQGGTADHIASTVADKLDVASEYLRDKDSDQVLSDLEDLVRRRPLESLLAAAGIGLLLSRIIR